MSELTLEALANRIAALEARLLRMETASPQKKDWRRTLGTVTGDEVMREIVAAAAELREAERREIKE